MQPITQKQINILKVLVIGRPVIAPWHHTDLNALLNRKLAEMHYAHQASGKLSSNSIWSITDLGRDFLQNERAGQ